MLLDCVSRAIFPMRRAPCMRCAYQIASQLTQTLTNLTLPPFAMSFQVFNGMMALLWATICIYRLERNYFDFSFYENPLYNVFVLHFVFSLTLKNSAFHFSSKFWLS